MPNKVIIIAVITFANDPWGEFKDFLRINSSNKVPKINHDNCFNSNRSVKRLPYGLALLRGSISAFNTASLVPKLLKNWRANPEDLIIASITKSEKPKNAKIK